MNVENTERNLFMPYNKALPSHKPQSFNKVWWISPVPNFMQIGTKIKKSKGKFQSRP
jgi:hypothetical protein